MSLLLKWVNIFCLLHFLFNALISFMIKQQYIKSDTLRIYYHDMVRTTVLISELLFGLFIFHSSSSMVVRIFNSIFTNFAIYFLITLNGDNLFDYARFYKRFLLENYYFMGLPVIILSFFLFEFTKHINFPNDKQYLLLIICAYYTVVSSYEDI